MILTQVIPSDFLGTTNQASLFLRTDNTQIARFHEFGGVAIGRGAIANENDAIAIGERAVATQSSIVLGKDASMISNDGVSIGEFAVGNFRAVALGYQARANSSESVSIGFQTSSNFSSIAIGNETRASSTEAVALGTRANAGGFRSTAVGFNAVTTQNGSVAIGTNANARHFISYAIGQNAVTTKSFQIRLGDINEFDLTGANIVNASDGRFKYNVKENVGGLDFIMKLRPVTYNFDIEKFNLFHNTPNSDLRNTTEVETGFIAQEIETAMKETGYDFNGLIIPNDPSKDNYKVSYSKFVVPLVKAVQEQQGVIKIQNIEIENQAKKIEIQNKKMESLEVRLKKLESLLNN